MSSGGHLSCCVIEGERNISMENEMVHFFMPAGLHCFARYQIRRVGCFLHRFLERLVHIANSQLKKWKQDVVEKLVKFKPNHL